MKNENNNSEHKATVVDKNWYRGIKPEKNNHGINAEVQSENGNEHKATVVDENWHRGIKLEKNNDRINAEVQSENGNEHKATVVDENWHRGIKLEKNNDRINAEVQSENGNGHKATVVDENWHRGIKLEKNNDRINAEVQSENGNEHKATVVDDNFVKNRRPSGITVPVPPKPFPKVPEKSLFEGINMSDPYSLMRGAKADAFSSIADFRKAVSELTEITSRSGSKYRMVKPVFEHGGEAVIYQCVDSEYNDLAAKIYFKPVECNGSSIQARVTVLRYMGTADGQKYTLPVIETGLAELGGSLYYFEIMPYIAGGNVTNQKDFSFSELVKITEDLNEAIHSIHKAGLIHRDIKPDNIYKYNDHYVIGDFGVAMTAINGNTKGTKYHVGTDGYTAPEINMALTDTPTFVYDTKSDYYSLGPTLGALFEGHDVYKGLEDEMISASVKNGKLPLRRQDDNREHLENLLNGLCRFDAKRRFDYEDVKQWLSDHNYVGGYNKKWENPFTTKFREKYYDEMSLFNGITKDREHWEEGKELLFNKYFENFFKGLKPYLGRAAQIAEETWEDRNRDKGLAVFLKDLYVPGPIVWKGYTFKSLEELAERLLVTKNISEYVEFFQTECVSHWLKNTEGITVSEETLNLVSEIEKHSLSEPQAACYWFGNCFAKNKRVSVCGKEVNDIGTLIKVLFASPKDFYFNDGLSKLIDTQKGADLYGFLYSFGFKTLVSETIRNIKKSDEFDKTCYLISMLDTIAEKSKDADVSVIRNFFVKYGPVGSAVYTQQLVQRSENPVYHSLDNEGKNILGKIKNFKIQNAAAVSELFNAYIPLLEQIETMRVILSDNPFLVVSGAYENKGVVCTNLVGSFAFDFLGRKAPVGFCSFLENADGGSK